MSRSNSSSSGSRDMAGSSLSSCKLSVSSVMLVLGDPRTDMTDTGCILTPGPREGRDLGCSLIGFWELVLTPPIKGELSLMVEVEMLVRGTDTVDSCELVDDEPVSRLRIGS